MNRQDKNKKKGIAFKYVLCLLLVCAPVGRAGSIFMKNGYIIQGTIRKLIKNDMGRLEAIVVSYGNGKVKIYSRFIENWVLEEKERERLEKKTEEKPAVADTKEGQREADQVILPQDLELPGFEDFSLKKKETAPADGGNKPEAIDNAGWNTGNFDDAPFHDVNTFASIELGEKMPLFGELHGSLPSGWTLDKQVQSWVLEGPQLSAASAKPRIAGMLFSGELDRSSQLTYARQEAGAVFSNWNIKDEGYCEVSFQEGYEIYGTGSFNDIEYNVRQIVTWHAGKTWLISCAWPAESDVESQIEACIQSMHFVAQ